MVDPVTIVEGGNFFDNSKVKSFFDVCSMNRKDDHVDNLIESNDI